MSQPNIPNITPDISLTRDNASNLILASIAMGELGLAHVINAEGEKIQYALGTIPGLETPSTIDDLLRVNESVQDTLNLALKQELILESKLSTVNNIIEDLPIPGPVGLTGLQGPIGPVVGEVGFSAIKNTPISIATNTAINNFSTASYTRTDGNFNFATGIYTVPSTGVYSISASINYSLSAAISASIGPTVDPYFQIIKVSDNTSLSRAYLPVLNVSIPIILTLRTILGVGTISLNNTVSLTAGDQIQLNYFNNGLTIPISLGNVNSPLTFNINKIA